MWHGYELTQKEANELADVYSKTEAWDVFHEVITSQPELTVAEAVHEVTRKLAERAIDPEGW